MRQVIYVLYVNGQYTTLDELNSYRDTSPVFCLSFCSFNPFRQKKTEYIIRLSSYIHLKFKITNNIKLKTYFSKPRVVSKTKANLKKSCIFLRYYRHRNEADNLKYIRTMFSWRRGKGLAVTGCGPRDWGHKSNYLYQLVSLLLSLDREKVQGRLTSLRTPYFHCGRSVTKGDINIAGLSGLV